MIDLEVRLEEPTSLPDVIALLVEHEGSAKVIAGGTDILVDMKNGDLRPKLLISLARVEGLDAIEVIDDALWIGALVTPNQLVADERLQAWLPALVDAAQCMASYPVRNLATIGGNLCSASPSADLAPSLLVAGAEIVIYKQEGEMRNPLSDFFVDVRRTMLGSAELLTHVVIPKPPPRTGIAYCPFKLREANALAVASSAARLTLEDTGAVSDARVVLGAVAPTPLLAARSSELLVGKKPSSELFAQAAAQASVESKPINDVRGSETHRKALVEVLTRRALEEALHRAQTGGAA
ncbi:MAG TPA: xanthine dehydrogenase family protein subunit M [Anaerolineae bacterium]|nr:xanthine dehydrogenase family protein subunit M [Anaerolineae bacterium]